MDSTLTKVHRAALGELFLVYQITQESTQPSVAALGALILMRMKRIVDGHVKPHGIDTVDLSFLSTVN